EEDIMVVEGSFYAPVKNVSLGGICWRRSKENLLPPCISPEMAQSGGSHSRSATVAFGAKRTCAAATAGSRAALMTRMYGPAVRCKRTFIELADVRSCINVSGR